MNNIFDILQTAFSIAFSWMEGLVFGFQFHWNLLTGGPTDDDNRTWLIQITSGPWFNIKMSSYQYRKPHCGDKTVVRSSYLHNGVSYTGKMSFLYWISPQVAYTVPSQYLDQWCWNTLNYIDGLAQDCSDSSALAMELLQYRAKPSIYASPTQCV